MVIFSLKKISIKVTVISLYWFAVQQEASTSKLQISYSIYSKFSLKMNELSPNVLKLQEVA